MLMATARKIPIKKIGSVNFSGKTKNKICSKRRRLLHVGSLKNIQFQKFITLANILLYPLPFSPTSSVLESYLDQSANQSEAKMFELAIANRK